jgi:hypothetical protein
MEESLLLGGTGRFEEECRRWCVRDENEAAIGVGVEGRLGNGEFGPWRVTRLKDVLSIVAERELLITGRSDEAQEQGRILRREALKQDD